PRGRQGRPLRRLGRAATVFRRAARGVPDTALDQIGVVGRPGRRILFPTAASAWEETGQTLAVTALGPWVTRRPDRHVSLVDAWHHRAAILFASAVTTNVHRVWDQASWIAR